jgi:hypothetical protein
MSPINTPGVNLLTRSSVTPQTPPTTTDTAFIVVATQQGRTDQPVLCRSLNDFIINFGTRQAYSIAYDWLDAFFNEAGGGLVYVMRITGPAGALDTFTFNDAGAAASLIVNSIGKAASGLSAAIIAGVSPSSFNIVITGLPDGSTLQSYDLFSVTDAVNWGNAQKLIRVVSAGVNVPAVHAVAPLAGGSDDHASITDVIKVAALASIPYSLGCGQVTIPGSYSEVIYAGLYNHAGAFNRFAILDTADTASTTTLSASAAGAQVDTNITGANLGEGIVVCDWQNIPGLVANTTRQVPFSAFAAALIARSDRRTLNPNRAPVGANGILNYSLGKTQADWTDAQTTALVAAGVNPSRVIFNTVRFYGFRTLLNPGLNPVLIMGTAVRLIMAIKDAGWKIGQSVMGDSIDGQQHEASKYGSRISAILLGYFELNALFGATSSGAYVVDVGPDVNTPTSIANRELHAAVGITPAPYAETIYFELASFAVNQSV